MTEKKMVITQEYLDALPTRRMRVADEICQVKYDAETQTVYLLDSYGAYTGRMSHYTFEDAPVQGDSDEEIILTPTTPTDDFSSVKTESGPPTEHLGQTEDVPVTDDIQSPPPSYSALEKKKKLQFLAVIALAVVACMIALAMDVKGKIEDSTIETEATATEPIETETQAPSQEETWPIEETEEESTEETVVETESTAPGVMVLVAADVMLPGDQLDADSFVLTEMTELDYKALCATASVFTEDDIERITGMECTEYIPAGQYIPLSSVAVQFTAINPWGRNDSRQSIVYLPVKVTPETLSSMAWGQYVDIEVTVETKTAAPNASTEPAGEAEPETTAPAVEHHSSVVESTIVDTYKVQTAMIVDLLDAEGNSLYEQYSVWCAVPAPFQKEVLSALYQETESLTDVLPYYISVAMPAEQAAIFEVLETERMTVQISNPTPCIENDLQQESYSATLQVMDVISNIWAELDAEE